MQRWAMVMLLVACLWAGWPSTLAHAGEQCFTETSGCVSGRIGEFWDQHGGTAIFGFPIGPVTEQTDAAGAIVRVQRFQRSQLEEIVGATALDDIRISRLGAARLEQLGIDWATLPPDDGPRTGCLWFEQTRRNVCDVAEGSGFATFWSSHGIVNPDYDPVQRSLALFGLPLTGVIDTPAGETSVLIQWFERARFEWRPGAPTEVRVELGLLGTELTTAGSSPVTPEPVPTPAPAARGAVLYQSLGCVVCHGDRGAGGRAPRIVPGRQSLEAWTRAFRAQHGRRYPPATVPDEDVAALYAWLRGD